MKCLKKKQKLFDDSWLRDKPHHPQLRVPCKTISRRGKTTGIRHQSKAGDTKPHLFLLCFYGSAPSGCLWWFSWWCASPRLAVCPRRTEPPAVGCTHGWRSPPAGKTNKQNANGRWFQNERSPTFDRTARRELVQIQFTSRAVLSSKAHYGAVVIPSLLTCGMGKWVAYWMCRGCSYSWGKAGSRPLSLQPALLSWSRAGFSGDGLPLDSQCMGGENICMERR